MRELVVSFSSYWKRRIFPCRQKSFRFLDFSFFCKRNLYARRTERVVRKRREKKIFRPTTGRCSGNSRSSKKKNLNNQDEEYKKLMTKAFYWYLGENYLGQYLYDQISGGCYDGLGKTHVNLNQGAESTVSYIAARIAMSDFI